MDKIWICGRCKITEKDRGDSMCPCPRGSCEAEEIEVSQRLYTREEIYKIIDNYFDSEVLDTHIEIFKNQF